MNLHGSRLSYRHIDPHVPLHAFDEQWVVNVFLEHTLLIVLQVVHIVNDCDASPPAQVRGLANPQALLVAVLVKVVDELLVFVGQDVSQRGEIVNLPIQLLHLLDESRQVILGTYLSRFGYMYEFLVLFGSTEFPQRRSLAFPEYIPLVITMNILVPLSEPHLLKD